MNKWLIMMAGLGLLTLHASGETLALWENDALAGNEATAAANSLGTNIDSATLGRGPGGTATAYARTFAMRLGNSATLANAITSNRYLTISIASEAGYEMNLTNIFIRMTSQNSSAANARNWTLFSDLTGLNPGDELASYVVNAGGATPTLGDTPLGAISELQGVTNVQFRLYIWGLPTGEFNQNGIGRPTTADSLDDLIISGTTGAATPPTPPSSGGTVVIFQ
ncbi:MAG TPA: hypothetical protein PKE26_11355 [Kiritimatiellia bacterium]|nr:hypothetical protein [Kiritimatiellia bacterium]HMO99697.1 hypothetical protein [Kiritimatiellia bacterium]HMP96129.1 hypothetical protein [Kiritimatiellia bacterium]